MSPPTGEGARSPSEGEGADPRGGLWDVVVVGAGPAGALTALEAARRSRSVLLVDRHSFPRRKVCGACLSRGALQVLEEAGLGSLPWDGGAVPLRRLALRGWSRRADLPLPGGAALSREALDGALVAEASRAGALFVDGTRAALGPPGPERRQVVLQRAGRRSVVEARVVVVAGGLAPVPEGEAPAPRPGAMSGSRVGVGAVFDAASVGDYPAGTIHMALAAAGYVGAVRLGDGRLNVAAALDPSALRALRTPAAVVASILRSAGVDPLPADPEQAWVGTPALTRRPGAVSGPRLFAVGDAAGYVEPFTGEGMAWALAGARALAPLLTQAVDAWSPELSRRWTSWHGHAVGRAQRLCRGVAWGLRRPGLSRGALRLLGRFPGAAAPFVRAASTPPRIFLEHSA